MSLKSLNRTDECGFSLRSKIGQITRGRTDINVNNGSNLMRVIAEDMPECVTKKENVVKGCIILAGD